MEIERPLPNNLDAEKALLGAIILGYSPADLAIHADDFFLPEHRAIFRCAAAMAAIGTPIDLLTLSEALRTSGQMEPAGGAGYVASLIDGVPRISNAGHYSQLVREKAELRRLAFAGQSLTQDALQSDATPDGVRANLRNLIFAPEATQLHRLRAISVKELLSLDLKPREMILEPVLPAQGLVMLYSYRGIGKTFLSLGMATAIAAGTPFLRWSAPSARNVLYVDGELPVAVLRERIAMIVAGMDREPAEESLKIITPEMQEGPMPDLATPKGQQFLEPFLEGRSLVILDNLSSLCRYGAENEGESWLPVQEWALSLRRRGISVLFVHHAGKSLSQRGTSRREDLLDTVITLRHPSDYSASDGMRCEVHFEKTRAMLGDGAKPFEVRMESGREGHAIWTTRDLEDANALRAADLHTEGLTVREISEELGISKSRAHRLLKRRGMAAVASLSHCPNAGEWDSGTAGAIDA